MQKNHGMILALNICLIQFFSVYAYSKKHHGKHVHGEAHVQIGFEDQQGVIFFQTPSEAIIGFEHKAKNEAQRQQYDEGVKKLEAESRQMLGVPHSCSIQNVDLKSISDSDSDSAHTDFVVEYSIQCSESVKGKKLGLNFQKFYPRIKKMDVELTSPSGSKKLTLRAPMDVEL
jgi:hypothetical protein